MEKWIQDLRSRFADRKVAPPDGLWQDIQATLSENNVISERPNRRRRVTFPVMLRRAVAVAACLVAVLGIGYLVFHDDGYDSYVADSSVEHEAMIVKPNLLSEVEPVRTDDGVRKTVADNSARDGKTVVRKEVVWQDDTVLVASADVVVPSDTAMGESEIINNERTESIVVKRRPSHDKQYDYANKNQEGKLFASAKSYDGSGQVSVSVYGGGMASLGSSSGASGVALMTSSQYQGSTGFNGTVNDEVMLLSTTYVDNYEPSEIKIKHRQPLRAGMSVRFKLGGRWGLDAGMNYSYHSSTISSDDEFNSYDTEQKLHFVGFPIAFNYGVWSRNNLEVYLSAGGAVEFCVSGKSHTSYLLSDNETYTTDKDMRDRRPQWSVNASAGVQYKISDLFGVYLEPGVGYYFDNGSNVSTIYKEKPLNFNFTVGFRFMVK